MGEMKVLVLVLAFYLSFISNTVRAADKLPIDAIYSFGASSADTGSSTATLGPLTRPYGDTFFHTPQRYTDGRLVLDFLTEFQEFPYLSAYVDTNETEFSRGANFASAGSTYQPLNVKLFNHGRNHFTLHIQLYQFRRFKARCIQFHSQGKRNTPTISLPTPESFSRSLYVIHHAQNDIHAAMETMRTHEEVIATIPYIVGNFSDFIEKLYDEGARFFWVDNLGPMGCMPYFVHVNPPGPVYITDPIGCIQSYNDITQEFNRQLSNAISEFQTRFKDTLLIPVDMYSLKYTLIRDHKENGFVDPLGVCCGKLDQKPIIGCGEQVIGDDNLLCTNPSQYISWDGSHYTDAANEWLFNRIRNNQLAALKFPKLVNNYVQ